MEVTSVDYSVELPKFKSWSHHGPGVYFLNRSIWLINQELELRVPSTVCCSYFLIVLFLSLIILDSLGNRTEITFVISSLLKEVNWPIWAP